MWEQRSKLLFLTSQLTFLFLFLQMNMYMIQIWLGNIPVNNVFHFCSSWVKALGFMWIDYLLGLFVVVTGIHFLWLMGKQLYLSRQAYKQLLVLEDREMTAALDTQHNQDILVVNHREIIAITMGFMRPKIILSTGLLRMLDEDEVEAVMLHERFHQSNHDPLKILLMYMCTNILWYIPILKWSYVQYKVSRELMADLYSIAITGSAEGIGSALLKLLKNKV